VHQPAADADKLPHPKPASATNVLQAFTDKLLSDAQLMWLSMTYDQGQEMAMQKKLSEQTGIAVYFCDPRSQWQRGSNENTNGLVRQHLPKVRTCRSTARRRSMRLPMKSAAGPEKATGYRWRSTVCYLSTTPSTQPSFINFLGVALHF
jgi:IS30 family transposase